MAQDASLLRPTGFGGAEEMVKDLKAKVFAEREMKFLSTAGQGRRVSLL